MPFWESAPLPFAANFDLLKGGALAQDVTVHLEGDMKGMNKCGETATFFHLASQEVVDAFNTFQLTPDKQEDYAMLVSQFKAYCAPQRNETFKRYVFCM